MTAPLRGHDRRVGRRPMSAKREQFLEMIGQGWAVAAAARELGVSRSSADNWKNGYRVARPDGTVVVFQALTPSLQPGSAPFLLQQEERLVIAEVFRAGASLRTIAALLGRAPSTSSREVHRNRGGLTAYRPFTAEQLGRQRHHRLKIEADPQLGSWVAARLAEYWSPSQIARALPTVFSDQRERHVAHETIYRAVYRHQLSPLARGQRSCLRTGRTYRMAHRHPSRRPVTPMPPGQRTRQGVVFVMLSARQHVWWSTRSRRCSRARSTIRRTSCA